VVPVARRGGHLDVGRLWDHDLGHCVDRGGHMRYDPLNCLDWDHRMSRDGDAFGDLDHALHVYFGRHVDSDLRIDLNWHLDVDFDFLGNRDLHRVHIVDRGGDLDGDRLGVGFRCLIRVGYHGRHANG